MAHQQDLQRDPHGFRLRGLNVSRTDTFVDAVFAFSLTLLVIFYNDLPDTVAELRGALKRLPAFIVCFAMLAMFWAAHNRWGRRFGLADGYTNLLSLGFALVVLVYVYPLRMVISALMSQLSGGWLPSELGFAPENAGVDLATSFIVYSLGFGLLSLCIYLLNRHALRVLGNDLDATEIYHTRSEIGSFAIFIAVASASLVFSCIALLSGNNGWILGLAMWVYASLGIVQPWYWMRRARRQPASVERGPA